MTNGDRIRAMTDRQMAKTIYDMQKTLCEYLAKVIGCDEKLNFSEDYSDILTWLKQEEMQWKK